jgi:hypothetical protein
MSTWCAHVYLRASGCELQWFTLVQKHNRCSPICGFIAAG